MGCGGGDYCPAQTVTREQMAVFIIRAIYGDDFTDYDPNPYFSDVPSNHWAFKYIQKMYEEGITSGCDGGNFCPTQTVTREQMAVFIIRAIYGDDFTDYDPNPYFSTQTLISLMSLQITGLSSISRRCTKRASPRAAVEATTARRRP
jgi:hypothetical protein